MKSSRHFSGHYRTVLISCLAAAELLLEVPVTPQSRVPAFTVTGPLKNAGTPLNGPKNDFCPTVSADGTLLIFNSNRNGKYQDLYISYFKEGVWSDPAPLTTLNSTYNDETPFLSADGNTLIFSSDRDGSMEMPRDANNQVRVSFDLYWSKKIGDQFSAPLRIPGPVNTAYHEKTPALSSDGKTLYFTRWSFGGMTDLKVMKSDFIDGTFTDPVIMPAPFNTGFQDLALIPAEDLGGVFFSSDRPGGLGKWDIYFVPCTGEKFGDPLNLGEKINSPENDIYLTRADQRFFICSNREKGAGLFDIYTSFVFAGDADFETRAIHFDYNRHEVKKDSFPYLNALSNFLESHNNLKLEIIGHTDLHGGEEFNREMSLKRAEAVKNYLVERGIGSGRFKITGAGKSRPFVNKSGPGFDELNRRTEFRIFDRGKERNE